LDDQRVHRTVLIVDDHDAFRASAAALLEAEGFTVVGGVDAGEAALRAYERTRPDVVLVDIDLPGIDGFAVAEQLAAADKPPCVVLISGREASDYRVRVAAAPVRGFLAKRELSGAALAAMVG
jgi:DNA-binding NarL/FixJ family response regulator